MVLFNGQTLNAKNWFKPESMQLQLGEKDSTASITVGPDAPEIVVGDWMRDDTEPGKGIVWRAKTVDIDYVSQTRTISLEHVIQTLKDVVIFEEATTDMMGGGDAKRAIMYVLGHQSIWALGTFGYTFSADYEFSSTTVMDAMEEICSTLADPVWTYDLTSLPFKLNINPQSTTVTCEMRGGRNLTTIKKNIDRSRMYTRLYPIGESDLRLTEVYVQQNTGLYGVIEKIETDQAYGTESQLRQWATDRLKRHCEPTVSITISGLELSQSTGESMDKLAIGTVCRVPIPELNVNIEEKITRLQWKDKIKDPEDVTVTLANNREDIATIYKSESSTTSKSSSTSAKISGKTDNKIEDETKGLYTQINRTAASIRQEAGDTKLELQSSIDEQASRISIVVEGTGKNAKIKPASIVTAINDSNESSVAISAKHITFDGRTNLNNVMGVTNRNVLIHGNLIVDDGKYIQAAELFLRGQSSSASLNADKMETMIIRASVSGNVLTLTPNRGDPITFSKATTLSGTWSGNIQAGKAYKVTAKQNGDTVGTHTSPALDGYYQGTRYWSGNSLLMPVTVYDANGTDLFRDDVDVTGAYNAGASSVTPEQHTNSITLTYDKLETSTVSGQTLYTYYYKYTRNSAYRPLGDSKTVWW